VSDSAGSGRRCDNKRRRRQCGWRAVFHRQGSRVFRNAPAFLATQDSFRNRTVAWPFVARPGRPEPASRSFRRGGIAPL